MPLAWVEPHQPLLKQPPESTSLFKVMSVENLIRSLADSYMHFNRVDSYNDFSNADKNDGDQLPRERETNEQIVFAKAPGVSLSDYYKKSRGRTYACCLSLDKSDGLLAEYGTGGSRGKVCVEFNFGKLRAILNDSMQRSPSPISYNGVPCKQFLSINYGLAEYVDLEKHKRNEDRVANPIQYAHFKDLKYAKERELRITLHALGIGEFVLNNGTTILFPPNLRLGFDYKLGLRSGAIGGIAFSNDCDVDACREEMRRYGWPSE